MSLIGLGGGHTIARTLTRDLDGLHVQQRRKEITASQCQTEATKLIKGALQLLKKKEPSSFQEARRTGSGGFIEILKAIATTGFGQKVLFEKDVNAGKGILKTKEGYPQKKNERTADGVEETENVVTMEEFVGVRFYVDRAAPIV